jgi:hypothetical protein
MILYNLKTDGINLFRITKFDDDMNMESSYLVGHTVCECPQGHKPTCRHRKMLPLMLDRIDTPWFYCFDDGLWYDPLGTQLADQDHLRLLPKGVTMMTLDDPAQVHNAIAEAVGEPLVGPLPPRDPQTLRRRM